MRLYQLSYSNEKTTYTLIPIQDTSDLQLSKIYKCDHCDMTFPTEIRLFYHRLTHERLKQQQKKKQPIKRSITNTSSIKVVKVESMANKLSNYKCTLCKFFAETKNSLLKHYKSVHHNKSKITKVQTITTSKDKKIEEEKDDSEQAQFLCTTCNLKFNDQVDFDFHSCESKDQKMFSCNLCNFECPTRVGLLNHATRKHKSSTTIQSYECEECDYKCTNRHTMNSHKRKHKGIEPVQSIKYSCNDCQFKTRSKNVLLLHIHKNHKLEGCQVEQDEIIQKRPEFYKCEQCDYTNKNKYELKIHVIRKHSEEYNHSCDECGKKYKLKGDLTNHIRFQHREQPIICDVCGKTCGKILTF